MTHYFISYSFAQGGIITVYDKEEKRDTAFNLSHHLHSHLGNVQGEKGPFEPS